MKVLHGFGSAGSSRSLRRTAASGGIANTATVMKLAETKQVHPAKLGDPTADELSRWIDAGRCWWCESDRVYKSLSQHWTRGHGLDLQHVRDILHVHKRHSFICDDLQMRFRERGKKYYDPERLRTPKGGERELSEFGKEANRRKLKNMLVKPGRPPLDVRREIAIKAGQAAREANRRPRTCVICGVTFYRYEVGGPRKTCSRACDTERRRQLGRTIRVAQLSNYSPRVSICPICKSAYTGRRKACSTECSHELRSNQAKERQGWHQANKVRLQKLSQKPVLQCSESSCDRKAICKGLCSMHYQRLRARLR